MAYVQYTRQFIQSDLSFSSAILNRYSQTLGSDLNYYMNNGNYQDVYRVFYGQYPYKMLAFAGYGMVSDSNGVLTKGTVTGYFDAITTSGTPFRPTDPYYFDSHNEITGVSISAKSLYKAALTLSNSDDLLLINEALKKDDVFILSTYNDNANGLAGNDRMYGNPGSDYLNGGSGNDSIYGGDGSDALVGGIGQDYLSGGYDGNTFVFNAISETSNLEKTCDLIVDFDSFERCQERADWNGSSPLSNDKIDLNLIDASTKLSGNNAFVFRGTTAFTTSTAGEIYFKQFDTTGTSNDYTLVYIDNDSDTASEAIIKLVGLIDFTAYDFIL